jgi:hypothetical protein
MLKLDNNLLDDLGLGSLPEEQKRAMLQHIYDTLELRVGTNLANQMTDQQLEEFEKFIDDGGDANQAQALQWLETNLPHYKQVVNEVFEALKAEIKQMAPQILASSTSSQQQQPVQDQSQPQSQTPLPQPPQPMPQQPQVPATGYPSGPQSQSKQSSPRPTQDYYDVQQPSQQQPPYQFPVQQPPAGPGTNDVQPPRYPGQ